MGRIGLIGAMDSEVELLLAHMSGRRTKAVAGVTFHSGKLCDKDVVVARCGVGKVSAALCTQAMIDHYKVEAIVNTGAAGAVDACLKVGDLVLCTEAIQHDFNVKALGYARGNLCSTDRDIPTRFTADEPLRRWIRAAAAQLPQAPAVWEGVIVSGDLFISDAVIKSKLHASFGALAAEMEGAAVAQVASANRVPFLIVRAISDLADGSQPTAYDVFELEAAHTSAMLLLKAFS